MFEEIRYDLTMDREIVDRFGEVSDPESRAVVVIVVGFILVLGLGYALLYFWAGTYEAEMAVRAARSFGPLGLVIGLVGAVGVAVVVSMGTAKTIDSAMQNIGKMAVTIDQYGIKLRSAHADVVYRWGAVQKVASMETGIGINLYGSNFLALPNECLPEGLGHDRALNLINRWRAA